MKDKIITFSFIVCLILFMILGIFIKDKDISYQERRKLAKLPTDWNTVLDEDSTFFDDLDDYFLDQFPFRDWFRKVKGIASVKLFNKKIEHQVFVQNNYLFQLDTVLNTKSVNHLTDRVNYINNEYLTNQNIYFGMIPDKNYYLDDSSVPKIDYDKLENLLKENLSNNIKFIDLKDTLSLDSYYRTDIHWKQDKLEPVVRKLQNEMNLDNTIFPSSRHEYNSFYGALYGRISSEVPADTLVYLTSDNINKATVYNYEKKITQKVYTEEYLKNVDSYDVYLSGATPVLVINNDNSSNDRELIIFRDSFGSSISPLLIDNYNKITLIDLRYINSKLLGNIDEVSFDTADDILFLYSVPIINNSFTLK